jgi:cyclophilin family peptidyl-prolyl cis-trans isomerase
MANSGTPNSAGSQFFIMHGPASFLDGKYTAFGHLIDGMSVLNDIANTPVGPNAMMGGEQSKPLEWTTVKSVKIMARSAAMATGQAAKAATPAKAAGTEAKAAAKTETKTVTETKTKEVMGQAAETAKSPAKEVAPADSAQGQKQ